jgi:hypothetical protein
VASRRFAALLMQGERQAHRIQALQADPRNGSLQVEGCLARDLGIIDTAVSSSLRVPRPGIRRVGAIWDTFSF